MTKLPKPKPPTREEIIFITGRVRAWVKAGTVADDEDEIARAVQAAAYGYTLARVLGVDKTISEFCDHFHDSIKKVDAMDPRKYKRRVRMLDKARRDLASGKAESPFED